MEVKEAVAAAKRYVAEVFAEESPEEIGLEEVTFDDVAGAWDVTVGFARTFGRPAGPLGLRPRREFKTVRIADTDGRVLSLRHRLTASA